jgi:hypothetical protein
MIVIYSFLVLATVITIINYDRTVITIVNYDPKTFIVQATDWSLSRKTHLDGAVTFVVMTIIQLS